MPTDKGEAKVVAKPGRYLILLFYLQGEGRYLILLCYNKKLVT
jgi:hypothetical protein